METILAPPKTEQQLLYKRWIEALRSGGYKQTKRRLKDFTGYCCLGVAGSALFSLDETLELIDKLFLSPVELEKLGIDKYLSEEEREYILTNIKKISDLPILVKRFRVLTNLNDMQSFRFDQIADFLEDMAEKFRWDTD